MFSDAREFVIMNLLKVVLKIKLKSQSIGDFICHLRKSEELHLISKMLCLNGLSNYFLLYEHLGNVDHVCTHTHTQI